MAEHINNLDLIGSGGHVWAWDQPVIVGKSVGSVALRGEYSQVTSVGARPGRIAGRGGGPAIIKTSGATRSLADAAMTTMENNIEVLVTGGDEVPWEDDCGRTGTAMMLTAFRRAGHRLYGKDGAGNVVVWQKYTLEIKELNGEF